MNIKSNPDIIVSLTSFPEAIPYAIKAILSIINGSILPNKIVLYLDTDKFPEGKIPYELENLKRQYNILDIRFNPMDIRSYKKLIPALKDFPDDIIVTIDDDIAYHKHMLRNLVMWHKKHPTSIIANRVRKAILHKPYRFWRKYKWYDFIFNRSIKHHLSMQTGVGGVLYPPHSLDEKMLDPDLFMTIAPTTDDIWFWTAAISQGTYVIPVPRWQPKLIEIGKPLNLALKNINLKQNDDKNLKALEAIMKHFPHIKSILEKEK